jgi:2'-hydroxyisoflavone reductase
MNVLVLGGTRFLGRHLVEALQARGHAVTLFNRGSRPDLFAGLEQLRGDRSLGPEGLAALRGRRWDAVIDTCGYVPRLVDAGVAQLRDSTGRYVFVSSISVYAAFGDGPDEQAPVETLADPSSEDVPRHYGALKAACEQVVARGFGDRALSVRPGLIVGPFDPTGRFTYWPLRVARGGEVLAPGDPDAPVQFIDARDLARWIVRLVERGVGGVFNATGPAQPLAIGALLQACARVAQADCRFTWVSEAFLLAQGVQPWTELPLWVTHADAGLDRTVITRALGEGLAFMPLETTIADTLAWARADAGAGSDSRAATLSREREAELLALWQARGS